MNLNWLNIAAPLFSFITSFLLDWLLSDSPLRNALSYVKKSLVCVWKALTKGTLSLVVLSIVLAEHCFVPSALAEEKKEQTEHYIIFGRNEIFLAHFSLSERGKIDTLLQIKVDEKYDSLVKEILTADKKAYIREIQILVPNSPLLPNLNDKLLFKAAIYRNQNLSMKDGTEKFIASQVPVQVVKIYSNTIQHYPNFIFGNGPEVFLVQSSNEGNQPDRIFSVYANKFELKSKLDETGIIPIERIKIIKPDHYNENIKAFIKISSHPQEVAFEIPESGVTPNSTEAEILQ